MKKWFSLFVVLLVVIYRDAFTAPFFQDDKILFGLPLTPLPNFPYRPVSQAFFYTLSRQFFGLNSFYFHGILFLFFLGTVYFVWSLTKELLQSDTKAAAAAYFYGLNVSLFALFFWVATSYFTIGAFFFFATLYFYLKKRWWLCFGAYSLALASNELAIMLPIIFVLFNLWQRSWPKTIWLFLVSIPLAITSRLVLGLPQAQDYALNFSSFFANLRWYLFRAFNLPEGVQRADQSAIYFFFATFVLLFALAFVKYRPWRTLTFCLAFFLLAALPFFFLPGHISAYYLTMALFGPALLFSDVFRKKKVALLALGCYLLLTVLGLSFLAQTHWIILKNTGPIGQF